MGIFAELRHIYAITIPSSVKRISEVALRGCCWLRLVESELPPECWYIPVMTFRDCPLLEPIALPSLVEFIEDVSRLADRLPFAVDDHHFLIRDDCLIRANGREVIRYLAVPKLFALVGRSQFSTRRVSATAPHSGLSILNVHVA
jgi:hypothetical protein